MAAGVVLDAFLDFWSATGTLRLTSADHPVLLDTRHMFLWSRMWKNHGRKVQGGKDMSFWFIPKGSRTFEEVLSMTPTTPTNPQVLQKGVVNWRKTRVHSTLVDDEILLNDKVRYGTSEYQFEQFVNIRNEKDIIAKNDIAIGLEGQLSAVPDKTKMEGLTNLTTSPYSLFAHVNQCTNGLFGSGMTVTPPGGVWTVKETIDPASAAMNGNCTPQQVKYSTAGSSQPTNIIGGMDKLRANLEWEQPDSLSQYQSDEKLNNLMYLTSVQGLTGIKSLMRGDQDRYIMGGQDPAYPDPQFQGIPFKRWDPLETAAVYDGASVLQTEGLAAGTQFKGPRVYAWNANFMFPVAHEDRILFKDKPIRHPQMPDTWVTYYATWWQLPCKSYKHQGILFPSADIYISAATGGNLYT